MYECTLREPCTSKDIEAFASGLLLASKRNANEIVTTKPAILTLHSSTPAIAHVTISEVV